MADSEILPVEACKHGIMDADVNRLKEIDMDTDKVSTAKFQMLDKNGVRVEAFIFATTTPEEIDNLVEQSGYAVQKFLEADYVPAQLNVTAKVKAGKEAVVSSKFKLKYDTNEIFHVVRLDVLPQPDGKVRLAFYGNSHKEPYDDFPTLSNTMPIEWAHNYLEPYYSFKNETFQRALTFSVDFWLEWYETKGKTNTQGNPYKNISQVHVEEGAAPPAIMEAPPPPQQEEPGDIPF